METKLEKESDSLGKKSSEKAEEKFGASFEGRVGDLGEDVRRKQRGRKRRCARSRRRRCRPVWDFSSVGSPLLDYIIPT